MEEALQRFSPIAFSFGRFYNTDVDVNTMQNIIAKIHLACAEFRRTFLPYHKVHLCA